jgi:hypothetical protein
MTLFKKKSKKSKTVTQAPPPDDSDTEQVEEEHKNINEEFTELGSSPEGLTSEEATVCFCCGRLFLPSILGLLLQNSSENDPNHTINDFSSGC